MIQETWGGDGMLGMGCWNDGHTYVGIVGKQWVELLFLKKNLKMSVSKQISKAGEKFKKIKIPLMARSAKERW